MCQIKSKICGNTVRTLTFFMNYVLKVWKLLFFFRELIVNAVSVLIEKHMAFYSSSVFRLVEILIPVLSVEMESTIPYLKDAICKVECRRGVGYDNTLR